MDTRPDELDVRESELTPVQMMLTELSRGMLIQLANRRKLTEKSIAKLVGLNTTTWSSYINGTRTPDLFNALRLADAIEKYLGEDKRIEWLRMLGYPDYVIVDPETRIALKLFERAPKDAKAVIRQILADPKSIYDTWTPPDK